jgi:hypothetical protein
MFAVFLQIDDSEWDYLREYNSNSGTARSWSSEGCIQLYEREEDAIAEAQRWNTASVQEVNEDFVAKVLAYAKKLKQSER